MNRLASYIPQDRFRALASNNDLPDRTQGSALFTDISGFSTITEKLTRSLGAQKGVDELSILLNSVYAALIDPIEEYGGSVISFAGDALIAWFSDDPDASPASLRAVTTALAMQVAMKDFKELSLKVSITSGTARRFAVGKPEIQILDTMAGQTIRRLAVGEKLTEKGEIILDAPTRDALLDNIATRSERMDSTSKEIYSLLETVHEKANPHPFPATNKDSVDAEKIRPWLLPGVYEREYNDLSTFLTELRPAVPMFVQFSGIDYDNDAEAGQKLDTFITHTQQIVTNHGGTLLQLVIGDKGSYVYAVFGAPIAFEDNASRAVHSAIELKDVPSKFDFIESVQIGLSLGTLRVGAYGSTTRSTYAALGDDVNLSAHLMTSANPGEILVTSRVLKEIAHIYAVEPREPLPMKGKAEPVPIFNVTGILSKRATRLPEPNYRLPMIGREQELQLINEKLHLAMQGHGQVISISAEAGLGKSRLVAEVIRLARKLGFVGYGGWCLSSGIGTPYQVWKPVWQAFFDVDPELPQQKQMRFLERELEDILPERLDSLPLLGAFLELPVQENDFTRTLDPSDRKGTLVALLEECLQWAATESPILIVLEDLHWVDPLSQELIDQLARISENRRVCFVLAHRPPDQTRFRPSHYQELPYFTGVELGNLSPKEAEQLIQIKLKQLFPDRGGTIPKTMINELTEKSEGNPFYIEELLNYLHDHGINPYDGEGIRSLELPSSMQTLILSRIDQLAEGEKATLKVASVIGRIFPFSWLHGYYPQLGEEALIRKHLTRLSDVELTPLDTPEPELAYLFKHIVTHEVAYGTLPFNTREQLHGDLALYLEDTYTENPPLETLAFHYSRSDNTAKKREYLIRSGDAAYNVFANQTALDNFEQALSLHPDPSEAVDLLIKCGEILMPMGKRIQGMEHLERAVALAKELNHISLIIKSRIRYAHHLEDNLASIEWLDQVTELARSSGDTLGTCDALIELSHKHWKLGSVEIALTSAQQCIDMARSIQDRKREAWGLFFQGSIQGDMGDYKASNQSFEASIAISRELKDTRRIASTLMNWWRTSYHQGDYEKAEQLILACITEYKEIGDRRSGAVAMNNLGNMYFVKNDFEQAEKYYQESLAIGHEINEQYVIALSACSSGITSFMMGNLEKAEEFYNESMRFSLLTNNNNLICLLHCYLGFLALAKGKMDYAHASFKEGLILSREGGLKAYVIYNLIGFACVWSAEDKYDKSAVLLSACSSISAAIGFKLEPEIQHDKALESIRSQLSETDLNVAWEKGKAMSEEQTIDLALKG